MAKKQSKNQADGKRRRLFVLMLKIGEGIEPISNVNNNIYNARKIKAKGCNTKLCHFIPDDPPYPEKPANKKTRQRYIKMRMSQINIKYLANPIKAIWKYKLTHICKFTKQGER